MEFSMKKSAKSWLRGHRSHESINAQAEPTILVSIYSYNIVYYRKHR